MQSAYFISLFETYFSYDVFSKKRRGFFYLDRSGVVELKESI